MGEGVPLLANVVLDPVRRAGGHRQREHDRNHEQPCRDPPDAEDASRGEQPQRPGDQSPHGARRQGGEQGRAPRGVADSGRNRSRHRVVIHMQQVGCGGCHPRGHHQQAVDATRATGRERHHDNQRAEHRQRRAPRLRRDRQAGHQRGHAHRRARQQRSPGLGGGKTQPEAHHEQAALAVDVAQRGVQTAAQEQRSRIAAEQAREHGDRHRRHPEPGGSEQHRRVPLAAQEHEHQEQQRSIDKP